MRALLSIAPLLLACTVSPVDFSDKRCPCDQGFVCDEAADRCVAEAARPDGGIADGRIAFYPLDDLPSTSAEDPSGEGPTLRCGDTGLCPLSVEGRVGRAFSFPRDGTHMVGVDDGRLVTTTAFTVALFVRPATLTRATAFAKLRDAGEPGQVAWALGIDATGRVGFFAGNAETGESRLWSDPFVVAPETWAHVAGTFDGIAIRLFVDGVEVAAGAGSPAASLGDLVLGGSGTSSSVLPWHGALDEAVIYDRVLSDDELSELANQ